MSVTTGDPTAVEAHDVRLKPHERERPQRMLGPTLDRSMTHRWSVIPTARAADNRDPATFRRRGWERGSSWLPPAARMAGRSARVPGMTAQHPAGETDSAAPRLTTPVNAVDQDEEPQANVRDLAEIPSVEVIGRAAVMLMSAAAERLGLAAEDPQSSPHRDLDEARRLIIGLAGLITASAEYLGAHAGPLRDGLSSLQRAFRESSVIPDPPGQGPGEKLTGPVY